MKELCIFLYVQRVGGWCEPIERVKQVSFPSRETQPKEVSLSGLSRYKTEELMGSDKVISL